MYLAAASTALMALPLVWGEIAEAHAMLFFEMGNHGSMAPSFAVVPQSDIPDCLRTATAARGPESPVMLDDLPGEAGPTADPPLVRKA